MAEQGAAVRRRRVCSSCGHRFTTHERYEREQLYIKKRGGNRQPFDRAKLRFGLARAAHKRPVAAAQIDAIVAGIEAAASDAGGELAAARAGEMCLAGLRRLDRIAYLQFASVYKQLDVDEVRAELAILATEPGPLPEATLLEMSPEFGRTRATGSVRSKDDPAQSTPVAEREEI